MGEDVDQFAVYTMTTLYNAARYGELGDQEAVNRMEEAFRKI